MIETSLTLSKIDMIRKVSPIIMMTFSIMRYLRLGCSVTLTLGLISMVGFSPAFGQAPIDQEESYPSSERDTFSSELGDGLNPLDLIHRANFSRTRSLEEYRIDQQQNLDSAASEFRQQQQQLLQEQSSNNTEESTSEKDVDL